MRLLVLPFSAKHCSIDKSSDIPKSVSERTLLTAVTVSTCVSSEAPAPYPYPAPTLYPRIRIGGVSCKAISEGVKEHETYRNIGKHSSLNDEIKCSRLFNGSTDLLRGLDRKERGRGGTKNLRMGKKSKKNWSKNSAKNLSSSVWKMGSNPSPNPQKNRCTPPDPFYSTLKFHSIHSEEGFETLKSAIQSSRRLPLRYKFISPVGSSPCLQADLPYRRGPVVNIKHNRRGVIKANLFGSNSLGQRYK
ncbi:hypothetical protein CEXT_537941 [Caerostris extrusa]|uniref:Uncharacterized protein n=1 Tax=Caerostris extrusa TaxID=172846 RepID=A0AAV4XMT9_CAEEX|nr:hypothetical protein CEXT_537941 [Caerostris extrusa]